MIRKAVWEIMSRPKQMMDRHTAFDTAGTYKPSQTFYWGYKYTFSLVGGIINYTIEAHIMCTLPAGRTLTCKQSIHTE